MPRLAAIGEADVAEHALLGGRLRFLVSREYRQDDRLLGARAPGVASVERRAHVDDRVDLLHRPFGIARLGARAVEVAAEAEGEPHRPLVGRVEAFERVVALGRRQLHAVVAFQPVEDRFLERGSDADGAHALDVGMTANRLEAGAGLANHPTHERELRDRLHGGGTMELVGYAHGPGEDRPLRGGILRCDIVDLGLRHARLSDDLVPGEALEPCSQFGPANAVLGEKLLVDDRI